MSQIFSSNFSCFVQEGKIMAFTSEGVQQIGITLKQANERQARYDVVYDTCNEYKQRLIELGEIEVELTQEQLVKIQAQQLQSQQQMILEQGNALQTALQALKKYQGVNDGPITDSFAGDGKSATEFIAGSESSGTTGTKVHGSAGRHSKGAGSN